MAKAKLYTIALSHPGHAVRLMLEHKGIEHEVANLMSGMHPILVKLAGFSGGTVPALKVDGRKLQGSLAISRALEEIKPEPSLFPADPEQRRAVEEAERWGEAELQPLGRRFFRWALAKHYAFRRWMDTEIDGVPRPIAAVLAATVERPVIRHFVRVSNADDATVERDLANLPALLDHADALIAAGTIGGAALNAADFQIGTSARVLLAFADLRDEVSGRPVAELAMRVLPEYPEPVPPALPAEWLSRSLSRSAARSSA